jgi:hypothetical protein
MNNLQRLYNRVLNYIFPSRRAKILAKMMEEDQKLGLYNNNELELVQINQDNLVTKGSTALVRTFNTNEK